MAADALAFEREALTTLLSRNADEDVLGALATDGWLDVGPDAEGSWGLLPIARLVAEVIGATNRDLTVGGHLAAAATLAELRHGLEGLSSLGVLVDARQNASSLGGRLWAAPGVTTVLALLPNGQLGLVSGDDLTVDRHDLSVLAESGVRYVRVPVDAIDVCSDAASNAGERHAARVAFFLAAEALGGIVAAVARTRTHVLQRQQFGAPLAALQVVQHRLVDMNLAVLIGNTLIEAAIQAWDATDGSVASWHAKLCVGERGVQAAEEAIQLHGGSGFSWELGLHHAVRRAQRCRLLLGGRSRAASQAVHSASTIPIPGVRDWTRDFVGLQSG